MDVFDDSWIEALHCILWRLREVDDWVFHRIIYELSSSGIIPVDSWKWFGEWPRSGEVDALIGLLKMLGVVDARDGVLRAVKPPVIDCGKLGIDDGFLARALERVKQLSSASRPRG